jgi:sulfur-carrier protein adenylyltransferase/sulfurtransferase
MSTTIHIPTALRSFTAGQSEVSVAADTVATALNSLTEQHPDLRKHLFNDQGVLRSFVNLYVNDENIRHKDGVATPLQDGDELMIIPSIAGGQ